MREILFRGKRLDTGQWAESRSPDGVMHSGVITADFDPATVGQWTGLTNSYGTKIFEGDICDFSVFDYNGYDTQYRGVVVYDGSRFMLWKSADSEYYGSDGGFDLDWVLAQDDEFEIAGNLWDSQELLREGENNA